MEILTRVVTGERFELADEMALVIITTGVCNIRETAAVIAVIVQR